MDKERILTRIQDCGIVAVVRAESTDKAERIVDACMEGGVFSGKIENLDLAIMASTLEGIHSVKERANIDSMERTFNWLKKIIEEYAK